MTLSFPHLVDFVRSFENGNAFHWIAGPWITVADYDVRDAVLVEIPPLHPITVDMHDAVVVELGAMKVEYHVRSTSVTCPVSSSMVNMMALGVFPLRNGADFFTYIEVVHGSFGHSNTWVPGVLRLYAMRILWTSDIVFLLCKGTSRPKLPCDSDSIQFPVGSFDQSFFRWSS